MDARLDGDHHRRRQVDGVIAVAIDMMRVDRSVADGHVVALVGPKRRGEMIVIVAGGVRQVKVIEVQSALNAVMVCRFMQVCPAGHEAEQEGKGAAGQRD